MSAQGQAEECAGLFPVGRNHDGRAPPPLLSAVKRRVSLGFVRQRQSIDEQRALLFAVVVGSAKGSSVCLATFQPLAIPAPNMGNPEVFPGPEAQ